MISSNNNLRPKIYSIANSQKKFIINAVSVVYGVRAGVAKMIA